MSVEKIPAGEDEQKQSRELHGVNIADTAAVTPERFYARLRNELRVRGIDYDALPRITQEGDAPACYERFDLDFDLWLSSASLLGATVPYRYDMPAEPNYCYDCTLQFKHEAMAAGVCRFPNTRFERAYGTIRDAGHKVIEIEIVGISRSKETVIEEAQLRSLLP